MMATRRQTSRLPVSSYGWRAPADVVAALHRLEAEPLPAIDPASLDAPTVRRAFQEAYRDHPVFRAALDWAAEARTPHPDPLGRFLDPALGNAITYVSVHAMHRWAAERRDPHRPAATELQDDPPPF